MRPVEAGQLGGGRGHVLAVRSFGRGGERLEGVARGRLLRGWELGLHLLLLAPLLLPQELLGLQEHAGVEASSAGPGAQVAVAGALVAGVARVLLGRLEALPRGTRPVPRVLGHRAGGLTRLPGGKQR